VINVDIHYTNHTLYIHKTTGNLVCGFFIP
jgi:hypothetical protein